MVSCHYFAEAVAACGGGLLILSGCKRRHFVQQIMWGALRTLSLFLVSCFVFCVCVFWRSGRVGQLCLTWPCVSVVSGRELFEWLSCADRRGHAPPPFGRCVLQHSGESEDVRGERVSDDTVFFFVVVCIKALRPTPRAVAAAFV